MKELKILSWWLVLIGMLLFCSLGAGEVAHWWSFAVYFSGAVGAVLALAKIIHIMWNYSR
jgi:hypothetical protein